MSKELTIIANWKMNLELAEARELAEQIVLAAKQTKHKIGIAPSFPYLSEVLHRTQGSSVFVAAQNIASTDLGAYTGEVAALQLKSIGIESVIIGHSERRSYFHETDDIVNEKIKRALKSGLKVVLCVGEALEIRKQGRAEQVVVDQIRAALKGLDAKDMDSLCIAYEPIWAIGTGVTASAADAEAMHLAIRNVIAELYDSGLAELSTIIYGGSVKPTNAGELFAQKNIDGALVGGASLKIEDFSVIMGG